MSDKPTYEELEQRVKEFEKEALLRSQTEEAMLESEEKYRKLFHHSNDGIFLHDFEGNIIDVNQKVLDCFGYTKPEMLAAKIPLLHPPEALTKSKWAFETIIRYGFVNFEIDFIRKNGEVFPAEVSSSLFKIGGKQVIQGIVRDVTDRKKIMETLRESEEKFRSIFHAETDAIMVFDAETFRFLEANDATLDLYGYTQEEFLKLTPVDISSDPGKTYKAVSKIATHQLVDEVGLLERKHKKKDGTIFSTEITSSIFFLRGRKMICGIVRDISERKAAEEALRESEERYRLLVENANDAIFIIEDGIIKFPNLKTEEMTGYSEKELSEIPFINIIHPDDREMILKRRRKRLLGEKPPSTYSFRMINKSGDELLVQINTVLIAWEGRPATINFIRDITEQKRLEAQLQQAQKMEAMGTLAGGIAHDFNNLLMGIQGRTSLMLMDSDASHSYFEHLKGIEDYIISAADLTKQLLGFARGGKYEIKPTDLNELIINENRMFGRTRKEINIQEKLEENLWSVEVDQRQIEQVLLNIYVNAWQAMPGGGDLYIQTENTIIDEEYSKSYQVALGKHVKISITDTGMGMDEAIQHRIFDPFFTTKEMGRGTGLGLASAYGIIKNHNGFIDVYSEKGEGTTFNIYLPASEKQAVKEKEIDEELVSGTETILFVDDEDMIIEVAQGVVESLGYNVLTARGGKEAIEVYKNNQHKIDMVILDMIMPQMDGGEVFDKLKKINPDIKALLSSGYSINGQATEILDRGCNGFIQKPFNMADLSKKIREILDQD